MAPVTVIDEILDEEVIPQAIVSRPACYFSSNLRTYEDSLDVFVGSSFAIGNQVRFSIRTYAGHPQLTSTIYLPFYIREFLEIIESLEEIISGMRIPKTAIAWQRGEKFEYGKLNSNPRNKLREGEARVLALKIAALEEDRSASTAKIKANIPMYTQLSEADLMPSQTRPTEKVWQQIVGNVISHQQSRRGIFLNGYAERTTDGIRVTERGLRYLNNIGFSV